MLTAIKQSYGYAIVVKNTLPGSHFGRGERGKRIRTRRRREEAKKNEMKKQEGSEEKKNAFPISNAWLTDVQVMWS